MPSIKINSKGTTIKLTRAEVRAMRTASVVCQAVGKHHIDAGPRGVAMTTSTGIDTVLISVGEELHDAADAKPEAQAAK